MGVIARKKKEEGKKGHCDSNLEGGGSERVYDLAGAGAGAGAGLGPVRHAPRLRRGLVFLREKPVNGRGINLFTLFDNRPNVHPHDLPRLVSPFANRSRR